MAAAKHNWWGHNGMAISELLKKRGDNPAQYFFVPDEFQTTSTLTVLEDARCEPSKCLALVMTEPVICNFKQIVHGQFNSKCKTGEIRTACKGRVRNTICFRTSRKHYKFRNMGKNYG